ncbi:helix-turn-helix transcriptional regulator [Actinomadura sp. WAC 06369]|uniref:helix-turn-helix transcriptional regulator n=1 Tax=Actinomadura sp. WAC 06369 TaxID=2203193 RepID=UPI000F76B0A9|nr:helix-turn-helix domain-containing protein [Actinomadura sp. WAC 06369]RSN66823.1 transcriptional regulator [Actinomadura sp. WAC 06369]
MALKRRRLAERRRAVGYSQERLADRLGVERSTVGRWERAETDPLPYIRPMLAAVLGVSLQELDGLLGGGDSDQVERPQRLEQAFGDPTGADLVDVAHLRERIQTLVAEYDRTPSVLLLTAAGQRHGQVTYLRRNAAARLVRHELAVVEAESATLMGQLVWDVSQRRDHVTASRYFDDAIAAARYVRDGFGEAHAQLRKSYIALYGTRTPSNGLALAKAAARSAAPHSRALAGIALMHVGEALAMLQDERGCDESLAVAREHFADVDDDDPAAEYFTPGDFARMTGSCHLFLGGMRCAVDDLRSAAEGEKKADAIVLGNLSLACLRLRRLEEAMEALHRAIGVVEETRGGGGLNLVFAVGRELRPWRREPVVEEAADRLFALMSVV